MRHDRIAHYVSLALAAETPADLERILGEAHAELSESEYMALQGKLLSADNLTAPKQTPKRVG